MPVVGARSLLVSLITVLATVGVVVPAYAATEAGSVTGQIVGSAGTAVPDFDVQLVTGGSEPENPYRLYSAKTDSSGTFTIIGVVPASYRLLTAEPNYFLADPSWAGVSVAPGSTTVAPTAVVLQAGTVRGVVVSAVDGKPLAGHTVYGGGPSGTSDASGAFTIAVRPGAVTVRTGQQFWFSAAQTTYAGEGAPVDLGTIALDPAGIVTTGFLGKNGRAIGNAYQSAVVDGCRVVNSQRPVCPGVELYATVSSLQLRPGMHTISYEVRSPVTAAVRRVTRAVVVQAGRQVAVPQIVVPTVDPSRRAVVEAGTYQRGRPVVLRIREGSYVDGARPRLPVTIRVSGHVVRPSSLRWRTRSGGKDVLLATLPRRLSTHASLKVRVIVRASSVYAGQTSAATKLTRSH